MSLTGLIPRRFAVAGALAATILMWGSVFPAVRLALGTFDPASMAALRFAIAGLAFGAMHARTRPRRPGGRDGMVLVLLGVAGTAGYAVALSYGEIQLSAAAASMVWNAAPVLAALLAAVVLHERLTGRGWFALLLGAGGVGLVALGQGDVRATAPGLVAMLAAAGLQAGAFVMQKHLLTRGWRPLELNAWGVWIAAVALLPALPHAVQVAASPGSGPALLAVAYMALLPGLAAYLLWSYALARLPTGRATALLYLMPLVAIGLEVAWWGEAPGAATLLGGAIIVLAASLAALAPWKRCVTSTRIHSEEELQCQTR